MSNPPCSASYAARRRTTNALCTSMPPATNIQRRSAACYQHVTNMILLANPLLICYQHAATPAVCYLCATPPRHVLSMRYQYAANSYQQCYQYAAMLTVCYQCAATAMPQIMHYRYYLCAAEMLRPPAASICDPFTLNPLSNCRQYAVPPSRCMPSTLWAPRRMQQKHH